MDENRRSFLLLVVATSTLHELQPSEERKEYSRLLQVSSPLKAAGGDDDSHGSSNGADALCCFVDTQI